MKNKFKLAYEYFEFLKNLYKFSNYFFFYFFIRISKNFEW